MKPTSESSKCWFVANAGVKDKGAEPKFLQVMYKNNGSFLRLKENEEKALHECLTWGSLPGNNAILRWQCRMVTLLART